MRERGFGLMGILAYAGLVLVLSLATVTVLEGVRMRLGRHKLRQQAAAMASSGRNYTVAMLRARKWHSGTHYRSPLLPGGGSFEVSIPASGVLEVTGYAGRESCRLQVQR